MAGLIAGLSYAARLLSKSGAIAAFILGMVVFGLGGLPWAILLVLFFVTSSGLSHFLKRRKRGVNEKAAKGSRRDWAQVLANGGIAGIFVLLHRLFPASPLNWLLFAASLAAANADTWATELGGLSRSNPRLLTTFKQVEPGTSGAISPLGLAAALLGSGLIAVSAGILQPFVAASSSYQPVNLILIVLVSGFAGSLIDSLLGATIQAIYYCPACKKETERHPFHLCGASTRLLRGWSWLNNDWVNLACTLSAPLIGLVLAMFY